MQRQSLAARRLWQHGRAERQIAKTFFFWAIQGLRRQYRHLDLVFIAHTSEAWEFAEEEFFKVSGTGGHGRIHGLRKVHEIVARAVQSRAVQLVFVLRFRRREFPVGSTASTCRA